MHTRCLWLVMPALIFTPWNGSADSPSLGLAILGYTIWESPPELRPIRGVLGAAVIGEPIVLPPHTMHVHMAPRQEYAILERASHSPVVLMMEGAAHGAVVRIPGVMHTPEAVWFSPSGSAAVLTSHTSGRTQIVGGMPLKPGIIREIDSRTLQSIPDTLAVNDSGSSVLYSAAGAVYSLLPDGSSRLILGAAAGTPIIFLPKSDMAIIGDPGSGLLWLFRGWPEGLSVLGGGLTGVSHLAASLDGHLLFVAGGNTTPRAWVVNLTSGAVCESQLPAIAERLDPMRSADTFLISSKRAEPNWIAFRRTDCLAVVFVPALSRDLWNSN